MFTVHFKKLTMIFLLAVLITIYIYYYMYAIVELWLFYCNHGITTMVSNSMGPWLIFISRHVIHV